MKAIPSLIELCVGLFYFSSNCVIHLCIVFTVFKDEMSCLEINFFSLFLAERYQNPHFEIYQTWDILA